ncbi:MAG: glycosyltransferase family 4 protein [Polyangiaceae bacterium]
MRDLLVLNQSQSPAFQHMLERAAGEARVRFITGTPFATVRPETVVEVAPSYDRRSLARRAVSWAHYMLWTGARSLQLPGRPFVLAVTNPPALPHLAWALSSLRGLDYGLLIWDIYPDHLVKVGFVSEASPLVRAWHAANRRALSRARFVVTLGDAMADALSTEAPDANLQVIPNWADTEAIRPLPRADNPYAKRLRIGDELVVMYSGNLGATHGLAGLLGAAARLREDRRLRFLIIGEGLGRAAIEAAVARDRLDNVTLMDPVPWEDLRYTLPLADVAIVSQAPGTEHLSVPSKTYSSLAAGSALLALTARGTDLARLVAAHEVGTTCDRDDGGAIASLLATWAGSRALGSLRTRSRQVAEREFSAESITERWRTLLQTS